MKNSDNGVVDCYGDEHDYASDDDSGIENGDDAKVDQNRKRRKFQSQTSDSTEDEKAQLGKVREESQKGKSGKKKKMENHGRKIQRKSEERRCRRGQISKSI